MKDYHQLLARMNRRSLQVSTKGAGMQNGRRKSHIHGTSLDFADYKVYHPGDDIRQIDWNVYGRTNKPYIKRFQDEKEISVSIFLDATSSMKQVPVKWELARELAASLAYITLSHEDRLSFAAVSTDFSFHRKGSVHNKRTFYEIVGVRNDTQDESFTQSLANSLTAPTQLVILITDGLEPLTLFEESFKRLKYRNQQIWLIQLLSETEINPPFSGDIQLVDSENGKMVDVSLNPSIKTLYKNRLDDHNDNLEILCATYGIHYCRISDKLDIQTIILRELAFAGLIQ
ncbi:DUF58 domain-containing protein [Cytobacillus oceanisediminis]|uniref:DUF58 domain-containing protein n=2 Tax=Niallia TaxID=2837506 RepID=A0A941G910_NIACI|nr:MULTISPECIES: DUF58 domain-containing protein [Bacillaceae]EOR26633.1 hypothetical protein A499_01725 [Niallia nealsonii AAU1]MBQ6448366.1 DUF58 domain-containing protein [Bacillus sp. (in: firmicutes)]MDU1844966.1 DUF58 domain-containing protein [Niallia nealsonii]MBZ9532740.1 DUF58 domain-containing protein [Cytobacillus oceanisediminis]MCB5235332.1 DUF58 domain-containing protein [Niallia circulans]